MQRTQQKFTLQSLENIRDSIYGSYKDKRNQILLKNLNLPAKRVVEVRGCLTQRAPEPGTPVAVLHVRKRNFFERKLDLLQTFRPSEDSLKRVKSEEAVLESSKNPLKKIFSGLSPSRQLNFFREKKGLNGSKDAKNKFIHDYQNFVSAQESSLKTSVSNQPLQNTSREFEKCYLQNDLSKKNINLKIPHRSNHSNHGSIYSPTQPPSCSPHLSGEFNFSSNITTQRFKTLNRETFFKFQSEEQGPFLN